MQLKKVSVVMPFGRLGQSFLQRVGHLVRTGRGLGSAVDTLHAPDGLLGVHAHHQPADALEVAVAAALHIDALDHAVLQLHSHFREQTPRGV